jgi:hypothetical protein
MLVVVDNFKDTKERNKVTQLCSALKIVLIESDNIGYGRALNKAIEFCLKDSQDKECIIFAGNLDIAYKNIPSSLPSGKLVYVPLALEENRNRNPFLTRLQRRSLSLHKMTLITKSTIILMCVVLLIKFLGKFPSPIWTLHGSLFVFNSKCICHDDVFNNDSFLYSEELEFGSYMEKHNSEYILSEIVYEHSAHAATSDLIKSRIDFTKTWIPSFQNWISRWG